MFKQLALQVVSASGDQRDIRSYVGFGALLLSQTTYSVLVGDLRVIRARAVRRAGPPPQTTPPAWRLKRAF